MSKHLLSSLVLIFIPCCLEATESCNLTADLLWGATCIAGQVDCSPCSQPAEPSFTYWIRLYIPRTSLSVMDVCCSQVIFTKVLCPTSYFCLETEQQWSTTWLLQGQSMAHCRDTISYYLKCSLDVFSKDNDTREETTEAGCGQNFQGFPGGRCCKKYKQLTGFWA